MMLMYPFGITALYAVLLVRKRKWLLEDERLSNESLVKIGFLWEVRRVASEATRTWSETLTTL